MFKLKVAKERQKNEEIENDLRGLNHDQLIQNTQPYAFIAIKNFDKEIINKISDIFNLRVQQSEKAEWILVVQNKSENFKEDAITLFAASLALIKFDSGCNIFIGVSQLLKALLKQAEKVQKDLSLGERLEIDGAAYDNAVLTLSPTVQLALKQSGIHCITTDSNRKLDREDVERLSSLFTSSSQKAKLNRVG